MLCIAPSLALPSDGMESVLDCAREGGCSFQAAEAAVFQTMPTCRASKDELAWQCASKTAEVLRTCVQDLPCLDEHALLRLYADWAGYYGMTSPINVSDAFRNSVIQAVMRSLEDPDSKHTYFTQLADTPWKEFLIPKMMPQMALQRATPEMLEDQPESFDWQSDKGFNFPIQDQYMNKTSKCGSCWAFSITTNIAGVHFVATKKIAVLSVQQMVDCDYNHTEVYPVRPNLGCDGGFIQTSFMDLAKDKTLLVPAEAYPYVGKDESCKAPSGKGLSWTRVVDNVVFDQDEVKIVAALVQYGPLAADIDALAMTSYKSGVQDPWFFQCNGANLNHAIVIVGFGVDKKNYWRIQNSWGTGWGEEGFYRLVRGRGACGINQNVVTAKLAANEDTILV